MSVRLTARLLLLAGTACWGMTFIFVKEAVAATPVNNFLFWRFLLAAVLLAALMPKRVARLGRLEWRLGVPLGLVLAGSYVTQTIGLRTVGASQAAFLTGLSVVLVPLLLAVTPRRRPTPWQALAAGLATGGLWLLTLSEGGGLALTPGDLWVLACALLFAVYIILVGLWSGRTESVAFTTVQLLVVTAWAGLAGAIGGELSWPTDPAVWRALLFCALFATTFMYAVQNHYQRHLGSTEAAVIYALEPVFAALTAWWWLGEAMTAAMLAGGGLILAGMLLAELGSRPAAPPAPAPTS